MLSRQSTMFNVELRVVAVLLAVVIGVVHGQEDSSNQNTESTNDDSENNFLNALIGATTAMSTTESPKPSNIFDGGLLEGILNALDDSPLGFVFRPLSLILRPIFWTVDTVLEPVFFIVQLILTPVMWILEILFLPVRGLSAVLGDLGDVVGNVVTSIGPIVSLLVSNFSGILSIALGQDAGVTALMGRKRRGIADSMMGMAWTTLSYPFRIVYDIISTILSPFYYLYKTVSWPYHFIFGGDADSDISTSIATITSSLPFSDVIKVLFLKLSDSSQEAIIELLKMAWVRAKEYLLPAIDELLVWANNSEYVPSDIKTGLSSLHTAYSVLHMFGML